MLCKFDLWGGTVHVAKVSDMGTAFLHDWPTIKPWTHKLSKLLGGKNITIEKKAQKKEEKMFLSWKNTKYKKWFECPNNSHYIMCKRTKCLKRFILAKFEMIWASERTVSIIWILWNVKIHEYIVILIMIKWKRRPYPFDNYLTAIPYCENSS